MSSSDNTRASESVDQRIEGRIADSDQRTRGLLASSNRQFVAPPPTVILPADLGRHRFAVVQQFNERRDGSRRALVEDVFRTGNADAYDGIRTAQHVNHSR